MTIDDPRTLVSTDWLAERLGNPDIRVIDGSWYMPAAGRDPRAEFEAAHIPGARFFDLDEISDHRSNLPHMAPPPEKFASRMRAMGIADGQQLVIYDGAGMFSAPRVWWTFRLMGKTDVAVLDGGLPKWRAEGRPIENMHIPPRERHFMAQRQPDMVRDVTQMAQASKLGTHTILDTRGAARFAGREAEPRPGLRSGHIPGSVNIPFPSLLNADGTMKDPDALRAVLAAAGADLTRPVITTCGSGVTAAIISLALERIGVRDHALYDGSWAEWGMYDDLPIAKDE